MLRSSPTRTLALALVLAVGFAGRASAIARQLVINHQGRLLDGNDLPVKASKNITFSISPNAQKPTSGSENVTWSATYAVNFDEFGRYSVLLGSDSNKPGTTTPNPPLTLDALAGLNTGILYLAVTVDDTELVPRQQLAPAPIALNAMTLAGRPATDYALAADVYPKTETYTKTEIDALVGTKATDAVTALSTAVDGKLALKADQATSYTKTDVDGKLATKADQATTYTKAEVDARDALKADQATTYAKTDVDGKLALKADQATTYTKGEVDGLLNPKMNSVTTADSTLTASGTATDRKLAVNTSAIQQRVTGSCPAGQAITGINADGSVTCSPLAPQRVIRWMTFNTYDQNGGTWYAGNAANMFGGVNPSNWTDGSARAYQMSNDVDTLRTLLTRKAYVASGNAVVNADTWVDPSSTNGRVTIALLRVKNSTANAIAWTACFYYTSYSGWSEYAGLSLNGAEIWNSAQGYTNAAACTTLSIPGNKTSSVLVSSTSSPPYQRYEFTRNNFLAFYNNSLNLPNGLSLVDDVDTLPSGPMW